MKIAGWLMLAIIPGYFVACAGVSARRSHAFESVEIGETRQAVIDAFGAPNVVEISGRPFRRHATHPCGSCAERLWFENRLGLDIEAWSVELDQKGRVMDKYHWVSP